MALDVGDVRIGVALSRSGVIAEPLTTIERTGRKQTLDELQRVVDEHRVTHCVIGLPYLEGGEEGEQAEKTKSFARSLARRLQKLVIEFWDERHSSGDARSHLGRRMKNAQKGVVDRLAAAFILQQYLDHRADEQKRKKKLEELEPDDCPDCQ